MSNNCLVLSIDFDGCSDNLHGREKIISNVELFIKDQPGITKIVVLIGSLRQSLFLDKFNAMDYAKYHDSALVSCKMIGDLFLSQLRAAIPSNIHIHFEPLLTSDIFNNLVPGTTYQAMQTYFSNEMLSSHIVTNQEGKLIDLLLYRPANKTTDLILQTKEFIDFTKISLLYLQLQHVAHLMPQSHIYFNFYDDRVDIHRKLEAFFKANTDCIPKNVIWNTLINDSLHPETATQSMLQAPIHGEGEVEHQYIDIINQMVDSCPFDIIDDLITQQILEQNLIHAVQRSRACFTP